MFLHAGFVNDSGVCTCECVRACGFVRVFACVFPHPVITSYCLSKGIVPRSNSLTLLPWCEGNTFLVPQ